MSKAIRRPTALLTAVLAVGAMLAGCGTQPAQAGAAAIVGDTTIPLERIQDRVSGLLADDQAARDVQRQRKLDVQAREILSIEIRHELINTLARSVGARVDNRTVDKLIAQQGGIERGFRNVRDGLGVRLFDKASFLSYARDIALLESIGRRVAARISGTYDQIISTSRGQAEDYARRLAADPGNADAVIQQARQAGSPAQANRKVRLLTAIEEAAGTPLFGLPQGTVAVFPAGPQGTQWTTAVVRERRMDNRPDARSEATTRTLSGQVFTQIAQNLLVGTAYETKVEPSPRYGVWDPVSLEVVPSAGESSGSLVPVRRAAQ